MMLLSSYIFYSETTLLYSDNEWSILFFLFLIIIFTLIRINNISPLSITVLFTFTIVLFLGGRFLAFLIFPSESGMFEYSFFFEANLSDYDKTILIQWLLVGVIGLHCGMYCAKLKPSNRFSYHISFNKNKSLFSIVLIIILPLLIFIVLKKFIAVLDNGYTALYLNQTEVVKSNYTSLINTIFAVFLGLTIAFGSRKQKKIYLFLFIALSITSLIQGARGALGVAILFLMWLYGNHGQRKISWLLILSIAIIAILALTILSETISLRDINANSGILRKIHKFLYSQGSTLLIFDKSKNIADYPSIAYVQNIIPGSSFFLSKFQHINNIDINFSNYLSYTLDKKLYNKGYGLGWSIFSDIYLFSNRNFHVYFILFVLFGYLLTQMEYISRYNPYMYGALATIVPNILFSPRAGLYAIIPLIIYYIAISVFFKLLISVTNQKSKIKNLL